MTPVRYAITAAIGVMLTACAYQDPSVNTPTYVQPPSGTGPYSPPYETRGSVAPPVAYAYNTGIVSSIELVRSESTSRISPAGTIIGAVVGGVLGNQIGAGNGRAAATVVGAAGGALAGNAIGQRTGRDAEDIYRIAIQYDGGGSQYIDVSHPGDLRTGDRVRVDRNGQISRY